MKQTIVLTCEHGGCEIPPEFAAYFATAVDLLHSHRGWDPGTLELGKRWSRQLGIELTFSKTSRLLVDLNRSLHHRHLFSTLCQPLGYEEKKSIIAQYYVPHRDRVLKKIAQAIDRKQQVVHIALHSFTPELNGVKRNCEIGLLYDPKRRSEDEFAKRWRTELMQSDPQLRVRMNYPYRGIADGLTTFLRKQFPDPSYSGIELEINQSFPLGDPQIWRKLQKTIIQSADHALNGK